jgi:FixJ family two-component response regulator
VVDSLKAGACGFLVKPFARDTLIAKFEATGAVSGRELSGAVGARPSAITRSDRLLVTTRTAMGAEAVNDYTFIL